MKIAIVTDIYYPMINGVAMFAYNLANGLHERGHQVLVICPSFSGDPHMEDQNGVQVAHLSSIRFPFYPDQISGVQDVTLLGKRLPNIIYPNGLWISPYPNLEVKKILGEFQPDVIHNQTAEMIAFACIRYARKNQIPLVSTGHAYPDNITGQFKILKPIKTPLDAILRTYMASFLKNSEYATMPTELAIDDLIPKNRKNFTVPVEAVSNGVNLERFQPLPPSPEIYEKYQIRTDCPIVLYVGRVDPEKSIGVVFESYAKMVQRGIEAQLVVAGDGTDRPRLEGLARDLGIANQTRFLGRILGADLAEIYRTGTVFATASTTETQGIVLIEACASGLPIVAVDAGAVREVCRDQENGLLCQAGNTEMISHALEQIITDQKLQARMKTASSEVAKLHDLSRTLARFEEIYSIAIAAKQA